MLRPIDFSNHFENLLSIIIICLNIKAQTMKNISLLSNVDHYFIQCYLQLINTKRYIICITPFFFFFINRFLTRRDTFFFNFLFLFFFRINVNEIIFKRIHLFTILQRNRFSHIVLLIDHLNLRKTLFISYYTRFIDYSSFIACVYVCFI